MMIEIPDELEQWLLESANQRGISIKNLLTELLFEKQTAACIEASEDGSEVPGVAPAIAIEDLRDELAREYPPGSLGRFAQLALKSSMASKEYVDTSARRHQLSLCATIPKISTNRWQLRSHSRQHLKSCCCLMSRSPSGLSC